MKDLKELKYQQEIDDLQCNLKGYGEQRRIAYRWTFADINASGNFLPRYLLKPDSDQTECIGWGLSFFDSKQQARKRLQEIAKNRRYIYKKLGTHVAVGTLSKDDGISNASNELTHFTHFEYKDVHLATKFSVVEPIV